MNEKTFHAAKSREMRRFYRAVDQAIDELLAEKFQEAHSIGEYRAQVSTGTFVKSLLNTIGMAADKMAPLFERQGERPTWEVYLAGLRKLHRDLPDSYLFRFVLPMFGLEDLQEKVVAYSARWLDGLHAAHKFFTAADAYLGHLERAEQIAAEYEAKPGDDLPRLYASLKTWQTNTEMDGFLEAMAEFVDTAIEVVIVGPIQLYLMIGRDTFTLVFKSLTAGRLSDLREGDGELKELLALHDFVHSQLEKSSSLAMLREVGTRAGKSYLQSLREEETRLRAQLPTQELKRSFLRRYESGVLFRQEQHEED